MLDRRAIAITLRYALIYEKFYIDVCVYFEFSLYVYIYTDAYMYMIYIYIILCVNI